MKKWKSSFVSATKKESKWFCLTIGQKAAPGLRTLRKKWCPQLKTNLPTSLPSTKMKCHWSVNVIVLILLHVGVCLVSAFHIRLPSAAFTSSNESLQAEKIETVAKEIYGASEVSIDDAAQTKLKRCVRWLAALSVHLLNTQRILGYVWSMNLCQHHRYFGVPCCQLHEARLRTFPDLHGTVFVGEEAHSTRFARVVWFLSTVFSTLSVPRFEYFVLTKNCGRLKLNTPSLTTLP